MFEPHSPLFAQEQEQTPPVKRDPKDAIKSDSLWITIGILALVLVVGAIVLAAVDRWRKKSTPFDKESVEEVANIRELYESGEITHSEYERIRNKMSTRVKEKVGLNPTALSEPDKSRPAESSDTPPSGNPAVSRKMFTGHTQMA